MAKNKKIIKKQIKLYQQLLEHYEEMNDYLQELIIEHECTKEELRYVHDFIYYKKLDVEFRYFKEHAHEDTDTELPFPYLIL